MRTARGGGADSSGEPALGRIDQYDLVRKLGGGGFGVVYLARDTVSGVRVALKTLHPLLKTNPEEMEALREKFALIARLTHQNVAKALVPQKPPTLRQSRPVSDIVDGDNPTGAGVFSPPPSSSGSYSRP